MQPADLGVESFQPGGDARQMPARIERALGHFHRQHRRLAKGLDAAAHLPVLGDAVERDLGLFYPAARAASNVSLPAALQWAGPRWRHGARGWMRPIRA